MALLSRATLVPRKTPSQARARFMLDVLHEATIRVLLTEGSHRLTTTRVSERAGVSVGALYQYYEDRMALLFAAQRRHLAHVGAAICGACEQYSGKTIPVMVRGVVVAFVAAKLEHVDESRAIYLVTPELAGAGLVAPEALASRQAISAMIASASDAHFADLPRTASMFMSTMRGPIRSAFERYEGPDTVRYIGDQTAMLCELYLRALAVKH